MSQTTGHQSTGSTWCLPLDYLPFIFHPSNIFDIYAISKLAGMLFQCLDRQTKGAFRIVHFVNRHVRLRTMRWIETDSSIGWSAASPMPDCPSAEFILHPISSSSSHSHPYRICIVRTGSTICASGTAHNNRINAHHRKRKRREIESERSGRLT